MKKPFRGGLSIALDDDDEDDQKEEAKTEEKQDKAEESTIEVGGEDEVEINLNDIDNTNLTM